MRTLLLLACLAPSCAAWAQGDPLKSAACGERLQALQQAPAQDRDAVEALRRAATQACLGGNGESRRPAPTTQAPIVVPPPVIEAARIPPPVPAPPPVVTPPAVLTHCDAGGCWDSSGAHLDRVGPMLAAPGGGACVRTGATAECH